MSVCLEVTDRTTFIHVQGKGYIGNASKSREGQDRGAGLDAVPAPSQ